MITRIRRRLSRVNFQVAVTLAVLAMYSPIFLAMYLSLEANNR